MSKLWDNKEISKTRKAIKAIFIILFSICCIVSMLAYFIGMLTFDGIKVNNMVKGNYIKFSDEELRAMEQVYYEDYNIEWMLTGNIAGVLKVKSDDMNINLGFNLDAVETNDDVEVFNGYEGIVNIKDNDYGNIIFLATQERKSGDLYANYLHTKNETYKKKIIDERFDPYYYMICSPFIMSDTFMLLYEDGNDLYENGITFFDDSTASEKKVRFDLTENSLESYIWILPYYFGEDFYEDKNLNDDKPAYEIEEAYTIYVTKKDSYLNDKERFAIKSVYKIKKDDKEYEITIKLTNYRTKDTSFCGVDDYTNISD